MPSFSYHKTDKEDAPDISFEWERLWNKTITEIIEDENKSRSNALPLSRIKKIMKMEETIKSELQGENNTSKCLIASETPILLSMACVLLIKDISIRSWMNTINSNRKTLQKNDVHLAVSQNEVFDFLIDIVRRKPLQLFHDRKEITTVELFPKHQSELRILPRKRAIKVRESLTLDQQQQEHHEQISTLPCNYQHPQDSTVNLDRSYQLDGQENSRYRRIPNENIPENCNIFFQYMTNHTTNSRPDEYAIRQENVYLYDDTHKVTGLNQKVEHRYLSNAPLDNLHCRSFVNNLGRQDIGSQMPKSNTYGLNGEDTANLCHSMQNNEK